MRKNFILAAVAIYSISFFACKEEILPVAVPVPPSLPKAESAEPPPPSDDFAPIAPEVPVIAAPSPIPSFASTADIEQQNSGRYTLQIAVFPSEASARALVKKMANNGIKAYYVRVHNPAQLLGTYYRVRVGYFNGKSAAEEFARARLEPLGYAWWVDGSRNDAMGNSHVTESNVDPKLEAAKQAYKEIAKEAENETAAKENAARLKARLAPEAKHEAAKESAANLKARLADQGRAQAQIQAAPVPAVPPPPPPPATP